METRKRRIEVFSAGCACCEAAVVLVRRAACPSCEVTVHDIRNHEVAERAKHLGVRSVPVVVIDGKLASCCAGARPRSPSSSHCGIGRSAFLRTRIPLTYESHLVA